MIRRRIMRKFVIMTALFLIACMSFSAQAASHVEKIAISQVKMNFVINGVTYQTPEQTQGFIYNNWTYVPLRFAAYTFEQAVAWDAATWTVTVSGADDEELETIRQYNKSNEVAEAVIPTSVNRVSIQANKREVQFVFFNKKIEAPAEQPSFLYNGTLYVPLRFMTDAMGVELDYDHATRTVTADANLFQISMGTAQKSLLPVDVYSGGSSSTDTQQDEGSAPTQDEAPDKEPIPEPDKPAVDHGSDTEAEPGDTNEPSSPADSDPAPGKDPAPAPGSGNGDAADPESELEPEPTPEPIVPKKSYNSIIKAAETSISRLEASCTNRLYSAYDAYMRASTQEERDNAKSNGQSILSGCDSSFASIMNSLSQELTANGYDPAPVVSSYTAAYNEKKDFAKSLL